MLPVFVSKKFGDSDDTGRVLIKPYVQYIQVTVKFQIKYLFFLWTANDKNNTAAIFIGGHAVYIILPETTENLATNII